jgi:hypothetical protein
MSIWWNLSYSPIIPNKTTCCSQTEPQVTEESDGTFMMDADCVSNGQPLVCPVHVDVVMYVFGTDWWKHNGGSDTTNATIKPWCGRCGKEYTVRTWSYRG